jgi:hypothetical protein
MLGGRQSKGTHPGFPAFDSRTAERKRGYDPVRHLRFYGYHNVDSATLSDDHIQ